MASSSRDKTGFDCGPRKHKKITCPGSLPCRRFARCRPRFCTRRCSFKVDWMSWKGEEGDPLGDKSSLHHLLISITPSARPRWEPAILPPFPAAQQSEAALFFSSQTNNKRSLCRLQLQLSPQASSWTLLVLSKAVLPLRD